MIIHNQKGAVAPLIAVLLLVIIVSVAFVVDLGHVHNVKAELQRAVDAAALAGARHLPDPDRVDAVAIATAANNTVDKEAVVVTPENVILGAWDMDTLTATASDRFTPTLINPNAVYVRAERDVGHIFFFFQDDTPVVADAIAVAEPVNPIIPLTMVSCIPLDGSENNPGALPGTGICDIRLYTLATDQDDTSAWTSLTLDANAADIADLLDGDAGRELFEQIVFGRGLGTTQGIENEDPAAPGVGCDPDGTSIGCGLGQVVEGEDLSAPEDFTVPTGAGASPAQAIVRNDLDIFEAPETNTFNPLTAYNLDGGMLPRWYNTNPDGSLKTDDHFARLWSLDGFLLPPIKDINNEQENFYDFQDRLEALYLSASILDGSETDPEIVAAYKELDVDLDGVLDDFPFPVSYFQPGGGNFIDNNPSPSLQDAIADYFKSDFPGLRKQDVKYWPDFGAVMAYAGYPRVGVINGNAASLMADFLSNPEVATGEVMNCSPQEVLKSYDALRVQVPVIFAGYCEAWKAIANTSQVHSLYYVGLADVYLVRAWKTPYDYACGGNFVSVLGESCQGDTFDPPLVSYEYQTVNENAFALEGLVTIPEIHTGGSSSTKVYLVE